MRDEFQTFLTAQYKPPTRESIDAWAAILIDIAEKNLARERTKATAHASPELNRPYSTGP